VRRRPMGVGAMGIASVLSVAAHMGAFGELAQAFSAVIAMVTAFVALAADRLGHWRTLLPNTPRRRQLPPPVVPRRRIFRLVPEGNSAGSRPAALAAYDLQLCCICEREYEHPDMAQCPAYQGPICSLCCSLDARLRRPVQAMCGCRRNGRRCCANSCRGHCGLRSTPAWATA
ncbi:hypothetical protein LRS14_00005, partial [Aquincola sp. J276]|nr:hypothetical protein [Aquincola sp. J276]